VKILYLSVTSEIGGADLALLRMVRALDRSAFRALVGLPGDGPLVESFRAAGAEVAFFQMGRLRRTANPMWYARYLSGYSGTCRAIARYAREQGADVIHANSLPNLYGAGAARRAGLSCVWHARELDLRPAFVRRGLARRALRQADRVVAVSGTVAQGLFGRAPRGKVAVIYDSVDTAAFRPDPGARAALRSRLELAADARLAGIWCRFDEWKGLPVAIRAAGLVAREVPGFTLLVAGGPTAGHDEYAEKLRELAGREPAGAVRFVGWLSPEEVPGFVAGLDVAVHASTSPEPFGLVIAEAMAAGIPLVAPRLGSPLELVEHGLDGLLYAAGSHDELAAAIRRFLAEPELARECAAAARAKAERLFDVHANVRRLEEVYRGVIAGRAGR
jgi:glycosyltransferase involved in cell wall biosynthesis